MSEGWAPDVLGEGFERLVLPLDPEGHRFATLVRSSPHPLARFTGPLRHVDVLYVHGWSDYFFQADLARFWTARGARFHALDLHGYGRSLRGAALPGFVSALEEYDADLDAALTVIGRDDGATARSLVLLGHSTGGLTLTLWAARNPGRAAALVLNSPWLELQLGAAGRQALTPLVNMRARFDPLGTHPVVDYGFYTRAQREVGSLPDSPPGWRPERGFPTHPGWLAAILDGHRRVAAGVEVGCPALVLLSTRSSPPLSWTEEMTRTDSVLVVDDIARSATRISANVTLARIDGALHDVFLSRPEPREHAFDALDRWSRAVLDR